MLIMEKMLGTAAELQSLRNALSKQSAIASLSAHAILLAGIPRRGFR